MIKKKNSKFVKIEEFALTNFSLIKSDRGNIIGVAGATGEGKTSFTNALLTEYSKISCTYWGFDRMTWDREELLEWIDGKKKSEPNKVTGLKPNQLPEYSAISPDELIQMFYKRTWYEYEQIDAISTFNMCRDRHLLIVGNVPSLWDLDGGLLTALRFYVYIPYRGIAWVFEQENNPFAKDRWNVNENKKIFRKNKNPYSIPNFVCEIQFRDFEGNEKEEYYKIRNDKRVKAISKKNVDRERYKDIKEQRNEALINWYDDRKMLSKSLKSVCKEDSKLLKAWKKPLSNKAIAEITGMEESSIRFIRGVKE